MNTHSPFEPGYIGNTDSSTDVLEPPVPEVELDGPPAVENDGPPAGTINEILGWVDGDPQRAQAAYDAEHGKGDGARKTLLGRLVQLLPEQDPAPA